MNRKETDQTILFSIDGKRGKFVKGEAGGSYENDQNGLQSEN